SYARGAAGKSGMRAFGAGLANVARDTARGAGSPLRAAADRLRQSYAAGQAGKSVAGAATASDGAASPPTWAAAMKRRQAVTSGATIASQTLKAGDSHGAGSAPDISQKD
ncbi:MAG: P-type conjugative transfer protein TrbL, partial [Sphingopyxis solisilvae]